MKVYALQCNKCLDVIWSRARHDFRTCTCGSVSIDGGFDYTKCSGLDSTPVDLNVDCTKDEAYDDWNKSIDELGCIPGKFAHPAN